MGDGVAMSCLLVWGALALAVLLLLLPLLKTAKRSDERIEESWRKFKDGDWGESPKRWK